jgi:hypothetical protein
VVSYATVGILIHAFHFRTKRTPWGTGTECRRKLQGWIQSPGSAYPLREQSGSIQDVTNVTTFASAGYRPTGARFSLCFFLTTFASSGGGIDSAFLARSRFTWLRSPERDFFRMCLEPGGIMTSTPAINLPAEEVDEEVN